MDCTFKTDEGKFNFRVGAIIQNGTKVLMACNPDIDNNLYYSVGGRVMFDESLEHAILREVKEETGMSAEIERMAFIHENFFNNEENIHYHEISVYFYIKPTSELLAIKNGHHTTGGPENEYLKWIDVINSDNPVFYPEFFKTELLNSSKGIKHIVTYDA